MNTAQHLAEELRDQSIEVGRLKSINADLLAALEAIEAIGPKQKPPKIMDGSIAARNWGLFENARAAIAKAKGIKE